MFGNDIFAKLYCQDNGRPNFHVNILLSLEYISVWVKEAKENKGKVPTRGAGDYQSDEAKENARFKR